MRNGLTRLCMGMWLALGGEALAAEPAFIALGNPADAPAGFLEMCERHAELCRAGDEASPAEPAPPLLHLLQAASRSAILCREAAAGDNEPQTPVVCGPGISPAYFRSASLAPEQAHSDAVPTELPVEFDGRSLAKLVKDVNRRVNAAVRQRSDLQVYGTDEYWQPAGLDQAVGDCEDIALQKKVMLLEAGFPADRLFLAVVFRSGVGLHTVLVARLDDGDVVLDSATRAVWGWQKTPYSWLRVQAPQRPREWYRVALG